MLLNPSQIKDELSETGFSTTPFPDDLRQKMLQHIDQHMRDLASSYMEHEKLHISSLEMIASKIPDDVWADKMSRAYRIFPQSIAKSISVWADSSLTEKLGRKRSAVNVVYPQEANTNRKLSNDNLAIYWRCVRPGKPDAGRPHRDASFWVLEFEEGYDPKIPFPFDYEKDCIKIWIPLKGCTPKTTLQVIPKSHKMNIPTIVEQTEYGRRPTIASTWLEKNQQNFVSPIELSNGSCIIFDMNLVHRGPTHNNEQLRISAELCFILE